MMYVNEFTAGGIDTFDKGIAAVQAPPIVQQAGLTISAVVANSAVLNAQTSIVEVHCEEETCINIGVGATADNTKWRIGPGETRYYTVKPGSGMRVSGISPA